MAQPIVSWYARDNNSQVTSWDIGRVDAGSVSHDTGMLIWNNRGGTSPVSKMENTTITTKDSSGGNTGEVITDTWIEVLVDSMNEVAFTAIGGNVIKPIQAGGGIAQAGEILGGSNDGTVTNSKGNFAEVTLHANIPTTATAGNFSFLTRVAYQYV